MKGLSGGCRNVGQRVDWQSNESRSGGDGDDGVEVEMKSRRTSSEEISQRILCGSNERQEQEEQ